MILEGDAATVLKTLPAESVQCCVTSPPYFGLRDYGVAGQIGLEPTPDDFVAELVQIFREVRRVLRDDGVLFLNLGDSYSGSGKGLYGDGKSHGTEGQKQKTNRGSVGVASPARREAPYGTFGNLKPKDLIGIPWLVAFALRADGWYLRSDIIWHKPNPMPESVTDRPTKSHEYLFLLTKKPTYYYDADAIKEPSVTNDIRRPYGSQGAWNLDGRPDEQKHGGEPRSFKGSHFNTGKPAGWDTGSGGHGSFHRAGRAQEVEYTETAGETRNKRSVWTVSTAPFAEAHFATFPPKLIEPCILAGSSPQACEKCGAPWERTTERTAMVIDRSTRTHDRGQTRSSGTMLAPPTCTTTGWQPTCECENEGTGRSTILDPFSGAGTTGLVASRLGRDYIGIELNPEYAEMSRRRITGDAPLFAGRDA